MCDEINKRSKETLLAFAITAVPTGLYIVDKEGVEGLSNALITAALVGGIVAGGFYFSRCGFSLVGCTGQTLGGAVCSAWDIFRLK